MTDNKNNRFKIVFTDDNTGLIHIISKEKITETLLTLLKSDVNKNNYLNLFKCYTGFNLSYSDRTKVYKSQELLEEKHGSYYYFRLGQILYYQILDMNQEKYVERIIKRSYKDLIHTRDRETIDVIRNAYKVTIDLIPDAAYEMLLNKTEEFVRNRVLNWLLGLSYPEMKREEYESIIGLNKENDDIDNNEKDDR